jgi:hypothetical protein
MRGRSRGTGRILAWGLWALAVIGIVAPLWFDHLLRRAGRPDLTGLGADEIPYALAVVSAVTVGTVVASRRPRHPVGWLLLALGLSVILSGVAEGYGTYGLLANPGALPGAVWAAAFFDASWIAVPALLSFVLLLTPTGSLPSPRWRWWAWVTAIAPVVAAVLRPDRMDAPFTAVANPLAVHSAPAEALTIAGGIITNVAVAVAAASLVTRFRRARGVERLQLRWVVFAAGFSAVAIAVILVSWALGTEALWTWATGVYVMMLPLAIGAAILRYRLYDLDRIISRTLSYGLLTLLLSLGYAGLILVLGQLAGSRSDLAVAGATLSVAAVFQPARRRIQEVVDRRFDRRRYDAAMTTQAFSLRLRHEIDLDTLTGELVEVVDTTVQPSHTALWLREARDAGV